MASTGYTQGSGRLQEVESSAVVGSRLAQWLWDVFAARVPHRSWWDPKYSRPLNRRIKTLTHQALRVVGDRQDSRPLAKEGRHLLPLIDVLVWAGHALDTIVDVIDRAAIEAVLKISAADMAGPKQSGKRRSEGGVAYHSRQTCVPVGSGCPGREAASATLWRGRDCDTGLRGAGASGSAWRPDAGAANVRSQHTGTR